MFRWLRSLFAPCSHAEWHIPVLPYAGRRQIKVCDRCGKWAYVAPSDAELPRKAWG